MRDKMVQARREAREPDAPPPATSHLSEDAIRVAEGWTLQPPRLKVHVLMLIEDCLPNVVDSPTLRALYDNANRYDQARYERYIANRE